MRRYLSALAVALVALSGAARVWSVEQSTLAVVIGYDLDSTTFVYPIALGPTSLPSTVIRPQAVEGWFTPVSAPSGASVDRRIKTADYDPTVVSCVANSSALDPVSTGDLVQVNDKFNRPLYASIFSKTDANTVEFDRSVDLTQTGCAPYRYRKVEAGGAIYDGWFSVAGYNYTTVFIDVAQIVTSTSLGVDFQVECAANHALAAAQVLASSNITAAGGYAVAIPEPWDVCRVGMKITNTDDDSTPATENEKISVYAIRR
jgi:hypothetical protein